MGFFFKEECYLKRKQSWSFLLLVCQFSGPRCPAKLWKEATEHLSALQQFL